MDEQRLKIQRYLAFPEESRSETPRASGQGLESSMAKKQPEYPALPEPLMEEVCERRNLEAAYRKVRANKGASGVDGMTVADLEAHLKQHWPTIREQLLNGTYQGQPVKRVEIPKPDGGIRKLGIPSVLDRFIQQALLQVLQRYWDRTFSQSSYGFRPGRSAQQAVTAAQGFIAEGCRWVVDLDLEKFFDRVNHDLLMGRIAKRVRDRRVLRLILAFLNAGVLENGLVSPTEEGTPQGGPLSPWLSNVMLDDLDRELERRGLKFARYADDCNIYVCSRRAGKRVMASVTRFLTEKLQLQVNKSKSAVDRPWNRKFLGFSFTSGKKPKRRIASQALVRLKKACQGTYPSDQGDSPGADDRDPFSLSARLAWLLWPLQNPQRATGLGLVAPPAASCRVVEAVANRPPKLYGTPSTERVTRPSGPNRWVQPRPLANQ